MSESNKQEVVQRLLDIGISYEDAVALRRISMTLHRWHELECGDHDDYKSWALVRGWKVGSLKDGNTIRFEYDDERLPHLEIHPHNGGKTYYVRVPDKERGAIKRLKAIVDRYDDVTYYIQGDPRGCALYILRPKDVPPGESIDAYYSRGIPVYK